MAYLFRIYFLLFISIILLGCDADYSQSKIPERPEINRQFMQTSLEAIDLAIQNSPNNAEAYFKKAKILHDLGNYHSAILNIEKSISLSPDEAGLYFFLAKVQLDNNDVENALQNGLRARGMGYESNDLDFLLAELFLQNGEFRRAVNFSRRALAQQGSWKNYFQLGEIYYGLQDTTRAIEHWQAGLKLDSVNHPLYSSLSQVYLDKYKTTNQGEDTALYYIQKGISKFPDELSYYFKQGEWYRKHRDYNDAKASFYTIIKRDPSAAMSMIQLGQIHFDRYGYDSATYYADLALSVKDDLTGAQVLKGRVMMRRNRFQQARDIYTAILENDSTNIEAQDAMEELNRRIRYLNRIQQERIENQEIEILKPKEINPN